jgi:hypothetical protein
VRFANPPPCHLAMTMLNPEKANPASSALCIFRLDMSLHKSGVLGGGCLCYGLGVLYNYHLAGRTAPGRCTAACSTEAQRTPYCIAMLIQNEEIIQRRIIQICLVTSCDCVVHGVHPGVRSFETSPARFPPLARAKTRGTSSFSRTVPDLMQRP